MVPILPTKGKTRITSHIDSTVLDAFRAEAERVGTGYQTMMNDALKAFPSQAEAPVTESVLRRVIREEVADTDGQANPQADAPRSVVLLCQHPGGAPLS